MTDTHHRQEDLQELTEQLRHDAETVRAAYGRLRADEDVAWTRYVADVDATLLQMQRDLAAEHDVLVAQRAEQSEELRDALHEALDRVHGTLDDLRVQEALLAMDARDRFGKLWETGERSLSTLRTNIKRTIDSVVYLSSL